MGVGTGREPCWGERPQRAGTSGAAARSTTVEALVRHRASHDGAADGLRGASAWVVKTVSSRLTLSSSPVLNVGAGATIPVFVVGAVVVVVSVVASAFSPNFRSIQRKM